LAKSIQLFAKIFVFICSIILSSINLSVCATCFLTISIDLITKSLYWSDFQFSIEDITKLTEFSTSPKESIKALINSFMWLSVEKKFNSLIAWAANSLISEKFSLIFSEYLLNEALYSKTDS